LGATPPRVGVHGVGCHLPAERLRPADAYEHLNRQTAPHSGQGRRSLNESIPLRSYQQEGQRRPSTHRSTALLGSRLPRRLHHDVSAMIATTSSNAGITTSEKRAAIRRKITVGSNESSETKHRSTIIARCGRSEWQMFHTCQARACCSKTVCGLHFTRWTCPLPSRTKVVMSSPCEYIQSVHVQRRESPDEFRWQTYRPLHHFQYLTCCSAACRCACINCLFDLGQTRTTGGITGNASVRIKCANADREADSATETADWCSQEQVAYACGLRRPEFVGNRFPWHHWSGRCDRWSRWNRRSGRVGIDRRLRQGRFPRGRVTAWL
jgi:hypothetical protein